MRFLTRRVTLLPVLFSLLGLILVFFITQPYLEAVADLDVLFSSSDGSVYLVRNK